MDIDCGEHMFYGQGMLAVLLDLFFFLSLFFCQCTAFLQLVVFHFFSRF